MGLYLDDMKVGQRYVTRDMTVTESDIVSFAKQFDPRECHVSPEAAKKSDFGGLTASQFHTIILAMRLFFDLNLWPDAIIASPGMEQVNLLVPIRPGDTIRAAAEVFEVLPSKSKPDRGVVILAHSCWNQNNETVLTLRCSHLLRRRNFDRTEAL